MGGDNMKLAILYGGQGSQQIGMGKSLYDHFEQAKVFYDQYADIRELSFHSDLETLSKTQHTQPCMVAFDIVMTDILQQEGIVPDMTAGLSIGEYGALYGAKVLSQKDVMKIAQVRGKAMEEALVGKDTMMCAVLKMEEEEILSYCKKYSTRDRKIEITNFNTVGQIVIGGDTEQMMKLMEEVKENKSGKMIPLNVSGAFHTSYMKPAGNVLQGLFEQMEFDMPNIPIVWNVNGEISQKNDDIKQIMVQQVQQSVHFYQSIQKMIEEGMDTFIEIGFGNVLQGFIRKISKDSVVLPCFDYDSLQKTIEYVKKG